MSEYEPKFPVRNKTQGEVTHQMDRIISKLVKRAERSRNPLDNSIETKNGELTHTTISGGRTRAIKAKVYGTVSRPVANVERTVDDNGDITKLQVHGGGADTMHGWILSGNVKGPDGKEIGLNGVEQVHHAAINLEELRGAVANNELLAERANVQHQADKNAAKQTALDNLYN